ncbi:hypothetical protein DMA11_23825 [Marinilabiliaceae bacterium JC017]|nr:hypothetical protein DMA11_23825 [Marinilabiliaceae bacterium JC017]
MKKFTTFLMLIQVMLIHAQHLPIIPTPQEVKPASGIFSISPELFISLEKNPSEEDQFSARELAKCIEENYGFSTRITNKKKGHGIYLIKLSDLSQGSDTETTFRQQIDEEGYQIEITREKITLKANTSQGLFYGVQSLKQLLRANPEDKKIEAMTITDWPAMKYRGWMDDISRGPIPTMDYLKKVIRTMAGYKQNYFNLYTEHVFKLNSHPGIAPTDGFTAEEIKELEAYAKQYHIQLIGNQQCFGHMEEILKNPFYNDINDNGWNLNPGTEKTYDFLEDLFAEVAPAYNHSLFNINCDETFGLGSGRAKAYVDSLGMEEVYARHINRVNGILKKYDKRLMMWGDIAVNHQEIIEKLPRDLIILSWGYHAGESFDEAIMPFTKTGYEFMIAPGVSCWSDIYPKLNTAVINISNYVRDGFHHNALGMMNTCWDDDGENLFNYNWHGLLWGAEMSWHPTTETEKQKANSERNNRLSHFNNCFDLQFFGSSSQSVSDLLFTFDKIRALPVRGSMTDGGFWSPITDFYESNTNNEAFENNKQMLNMATQLEKDLTNIKKTTSDNQDVIDYAIFAAQRAAFMAKKNLTQIDLYKAYKTGDQSAATVAKQSLKTLINELSTLRETYIHLWLEENRPYWLDMVLKKYDDLGWDLIKTDKKVFIEPGAIKEGGKQEIVINTLFHDMPVYYTLDGAEPSERSKKYVSPFTITKPTTIKARVISNKEKFEISEKNIITHKGIGALKQLNSRFSDYNPAYAAGGESGLIDGLKGSENFADGRWQAFQGQNLDIELDFKQPTRINKLTVGLLQNAYSWILMPQEVQLFTSDDGKKYHLIKTVKTHADWTANGTVVKDITLDDLNITSRYLKVVAPYPGDLPKDHHAGGNPSFIFADEIVIY